MNIRSARIFGILFILSFVSYATGIALLDATQKNEILVTQFVQKKLSVIISTILITVIHTLFNLGLTTIMFNILKKHSLVLSIVYLALALLGTLLLALGAISFLLPVSISELYIQSDYMTMHHFSQIRTLSANLNFYLYQIGMIFWGCAGISFCYLLFLSKLVPIFFPISGYFTYLTFVIGCMLELFGIHYGMILSIPGGLFEIILSAWLIIKGFNKKVFKIN